MTSHTTESVRMSIQCPYCGSCNTTSSNSTSKLLTSLSAVGGGISALYSAINHASSAHPITASISCISNLTLITLAGCLSGSAFGSQLGSEAEKLFPSDFICQACGKAFTPIL